MTNEQIVQFMSAGRAVFTLRSRKTGEHLTYKIEKKRITNHTANELFFVSVLRGPEEWTYIGVYDDRARRVNLTRNSRVTADAPSFKGLNWFLKHIGHPRVEFRHEGKCCRCGRPLTHPDSIDSGIGPECAARLGAPREATRGPSGAPLQHLKPMPGRHPRAVTPPGVKPLAGFGNDCSAALDAAPSEPNLIVPLLLSLKNEGAPA
jgi:hypothetical protein